MILSKNLPRDQRADGEIADVEPADGLRRGPAETGGDPRLASELWGMADVVLVPGVGFAAPQDESSSSSEGEVAARTASDSRYSMVSMPAEIHWIRDLLQPSTPQSLEKPGVMGLVATIRVSIVWLKSNEDERKMGRG